MPMKNKLPVYVLKKTHLKTGSAIFSNLAAAFILAVFLSQSLLILTGNIFFAIVFIILTVQTENKLEEQ
jgi:hypothetical protein